MPMMNTETIETTETTTGNLPFPSHVKSPAPNAKAVELSGEVLATSQDLNNVLASAGNVHMFVRSHFVDMESGIYGLQSLIADILRTHASQVSPTGTFPQGVESSEYRSLAIAGSMFASEVIAAVRERFTADRYPDATIATQLSHHMQKANCQNKAGKFRLSKAEDMQAGGTSPKPRSKYYLLDVAPDAPQAS